MVLYSVEDTRVAVENIEDNKAVIRHPVTGLSESGIRKELGEPHPTNGSDMDGISVV